MGVTLLFQKLPELTGVQVAGTLVYVDEFRQRAGLTDGFCRGDECVGCGDNALTRTNSCSHESEAQGIRSAINAHTVTGSTKLREVAFEPFHHWATDKTGGFQHAAKYIDQFRFQFSVRRDQVQERD